MTKKTYKYQENNYRKILIVFFTIGAIVAAVAPFLHMFFSKESTIKIFGFNNARIFFYSLGMPITTFITALILSFTSNFIENEFIKKTSKKVSIIFLAVAIYYIVWTFTAKNDWNPFIYFSMIIIVSIPMGILSHRFLEYLSKNTIKIRKLSNNIPDLDKRIKTVNHIAKIMPDNNNDIVVFKAMVDVTGENLSRSIHDIKKELQE